jgi:hypothetical protein
VGPSTVLDAVVKRKIPSPRRESNPRSPHFLKKYYVGIDDLKGKYKGPIFFCQNLSDLINLRYSVTHISPVLHKKSEPVGFLIFLTNGQKFFVYALQLRI